MRQLSCIKLIYFILYICEVSHITIIMYKKNNALGTQAEAVSKYTIERTNSVQK